MRKIAGLIIVILLGSLLAMAQMPMPGAGNRPGEMNRFWATPWFVQQLGLTDAQIKQFDQLAVDTGMKLVDDKATVEKQHLGLMSLLIPDKLDEAKFNQQVDAMLAADARMKKTAIAAALQGYNLLTPEQQKKLKTMLQNMAMMRAMTGFMGMGGERHPGGMGMGAGRRPGSGMGMGAGRGAGQGPRRPQPQTQPPPPPKPQQ